MTTDIRDPQGRFRPGTAPGPGRPARRTEENYLLALVDSCPLSVWTKIVEKAVADASDGDERARHWLASFLIGTPKGPAPLPSSALVGRLLGNDPVLESAARILAKPLASAEMFPLMNRDTARLRAIELEAMDAILEAEAAQSS
jgi:hypothetical protein